MRKAKVIQILNELGKIDKKKIATNKDGNINMDKIMEVPEIKEAVEKLRALNVTNKWLEKNGFVPAVLFLGRFLKKAK